MPSLTPRPAAARRRWWWLSAAVLAVHLLVLGHLAGLSGLDSLTAPRQPSQATPPASAVTVAALSTRRIVPALPAAVAPTAPSVPPAPRPTAKPKPKPKPQPPPSAAAANEAEPATPNNESNQALEPVDTAQAATDSIAPTEPEAEPLPAVTPEPEPLPTAPVTPTVPNAPAVTVPGAVTLPASVRLAYQVKGHAKNLNYNASGELLWRNDGTRYDTRLTVRAFLMGARSMSSQGELGAQGLAPERFADKSRSEVAAHFERDKGVVSFSANTPSVPLLAGAQDRVSLFMQLAGMLAGEPQRFTSGSQIILNTVGPRDAEAWTFVVGEAELLDLPFGQVSALRLTRQPRREFDQTIDVWLAPSMNYLPVRHRIQQSNGDYVDQQLDALSPLAP